VGAKAHMASPWAPILTMLTKEKERLIGSFSLGPYPICWSAVHNHRNIPNIHGYLTYRHKHIELV